jgi:hypothetical protein
MQTFAQHKRKLSLVSKNPTTSKQNNFLNGIIQATARKRNSSIKQP